MMCFQGFSYVSVGSVCVYDTHLDILTVLPRTNVTLKQQSNIAVLQMMLRKGQSLCGYRESILDNLVVRSVDHLAPVFISVSRLYITINLKMEV